MKSLGIIGLFLLSLAQPLSAHLLRLEMNDFSYPLQGDMNARTISEGRGGTLHLIIDDQTPSDDFFNNETHFTNAIKSGSFSDPLRAMNFVLNEDTASHIIFRNDIFISMAFTGMMHDSIGGAANFLLYFEGNTLHPAPNPLVDFKINTVIWPDSVFFSLRSSLVDFVFATPNAIAIAFVPEPAPVFMMILGLLGILMVKVRVFLKANPTLYKMLYANSNR